MTKQPYGNAEEILSDAAKAHKKGLSYGEYKAGVKKAAKNTGYVTSSVEFLKRSEPSTAKQTAKAFIKI